MLNLNKTPNSFFEILVIQELKFWKIAQLFIVSVSLERGFLKKPEKVFYSYSGISSRMSKIAFLMDWAQMADSDFGLIH